VPEGVRVFVDEEAMIFVHAGPFESGFGFGRVADQPPHPRIETVACAVRVFLDHLQDVIVRDATVPWPGDGTTFPKVQLAVDGDRVEAWYEGDVGPRVVVDVPAD
jgi:hypothetical protein